MHPPGVGVGETLVDDVVKTLVEITGPDVDNGVLELLISDENSCPVEAIVPVLIAVEVVSVTEAVDVGKVEDISEVLPPIELTLEPNVMVNRTITSWKKLNILEEITVAETVGVDPEVEIVTELGAVDKVDISVETVNNSDLDGDTATIHQ